MSKKRNLSKVVEEQEVKEIQGERKTTLSIFRKGT